MSEESYLSTYFDVLKSKHNLSILDYLESEGASTPGEVSGSLEITEKSASNRMWELQLQGLLETESDNKWLGNTYELEETGRNLVNELTEELDKTLNNGADPRNELYDNKDIAEIAQYTNQGVMFKGAVIAPGENPEKEYSRAVIQEISIEGFPGMTTVRVLDYLE